MYALRTRKKTAMKRLCTAHFRALPIHLTASGDWCAIDEVPFHYCTLFVCTTTYSLSSNDKFLFRIFPSLFSKSRLTTLPFGGQLYSRNYICIVSVCVLSKGGWRKKITPAHSFRVLLCFPLCDSYWCNDDCNLILN